MSEPIPPPAKRGLWAFLPLAALAAIIVASLVVLLQGRERETVTNDVAGRPVPAYDMAALEPDARVTPDAFAGEPYLINAFASWCVPCRAEHPQLMALARDGVPILGVAYKDTPEAAAGFLAELGDPFTYVGLDPDGVFGIDLGVAGVPETFVVGADGKLVMVYRGPLTPEIVAQQILPALRGEAPPA